MLNVNNIRYQNVEKMYDQRSSKLFKGRYLDNFYVIKCYKKKYKKRWENDLKILQSLSQNENIIGLKNYSTEIIINNILYYPIVTEYAEHGDLFDFICNYKGNINKDLVIEIFSQIVSGIYFLNRQGWAHRDLKLENILVKNLYPIEIKITDFEFSTNLKESNSMIGTMSYVSPQIFMNETYNTMKNDIWSLGVILFILYVGKRPYDEIHPNKNQNQNQNPICKWLTAIKNNEWDIYWSSMEKCRINKLDKSLVNKKNSFDSNFKNLVEKMLCWDEYERISINDAIKHKFLNCNIIEEYKPPKCISCIII